MSLRLFRCSSGKYRPSFLFHSLTEVLPPDAGDHLPTISVYRRGVTEPVYVKRFFHFFQKFFRKEIGRTEPGGPQRRAEREPVPSSAAFPLHSFRTPSASPSPPRSLCRLRFPDGLRDGVPLSPDSIPCLAEGSEPLFPVRRIPLPFSEGFPSGEDAGTYFPSFRACSRSRLPEGLIDCRSFLFPPPLCPGTKDNIIERRRRRGRISVWQEEL